MAICQTSFPDSNATKTGDQVRTTNTNTTHEHITQQLPNNEPKPRETRTINNSHYQANTTLLLVRLIDVTDMLCWCALVVVGVVVVCGCLWLFVVVCCCLLLLCCCCVVGFRCTVFVSAPRNKSEPQKP